MNQHHLSSEKLQQIAQLAYALADAIHTGDHEKILAAQHSLSAEVEVDWEALQQRTDLSPKDKALARLLAEMALKELPLLIQDPANYPMILSRLRLLKNSMTLL